MIHDPSGNIDGMDWFPTLELRHRALAVLARLEETYHAVGPDHGAGIGLPPVDEIVLTLLSQSTTDVNSWRGFQALKARFSDWETLADAPVEAIEAAIRPCGLSRQKAPRIKALLQRLREERGRITLDFLADLPPDEALAYLLSFHGVGRKTASCVLLFSLQMPVLPVDTHVHRVAGRLALIPAGASADQAHDLLEALLPEETYLSFHLNLIAHGRQVCFARHPRCEGCPVCDLCPYGQGTTERYG
jgi:endonuclease-3